MNGQASAERTEALRRLYKKGGRVRLLYMDDPQAPPVGTMGTIKGVDDDNGIMIGWDTGSSLKAIFGHDVIENVKQVAVIASNSVRDAQHAVSRWDEADPLDDDAWADCCDAEIYLGTFVTKEEAAKFAGTDEGNIRMIEIS